MSARAGRGALGAPLHWLGAPARVGAPLAAVVGLVLQLVAAALEARGQATLKGLRYGRLMLMMDKDEDGSHIKGLLIS